MSKTVKDLIIIAISTLLLTFLVWLPHLLQLPSFYGLDFSQGFNTIYRNFDGLEYVIIAKTLYDPQAIASLPQSLPANYFAAHFPGYALIILLFAPLLGFLKSMLFTSLLFTILSAVTFYFLLKDFKLSSQPLFLSLLFLLLPARWLVVHSVGSAEPLFIFFVLAAVYWFLKYEQTLKSKLILLTTLFGVLAQFTRPPGILLFIALALYVGWKLLNDSNSNFTRKIRKTLPYFPLLLIPASLLVVFYWYSLTYQDFFAYFHSGDNIHLTFPPFQVFNINQTWVGDIWLEDIVYIFLLGFLGGLLLLKQKLILPGIFVLTYLSAAILVAHRDIARYTLPIFPFLLIAFEKVLISREFKIAFTIIALGIYLYAQNFILNNTAPVPSLQVFN